MQQAISNKQSAKDWFEKGNTHMRTGNLAGAMHAFKQSIKFNPHVASPWLALAHILDTNFQYNDARQCLLNATQAQPKHVQARQKLALAHKKLGYVEAAKNELNKALELAPDSATNYFLLAQLYEDLGRSQQAADAYRKSLSIQPERYDALSCLLGLGKDVDIDNDIHTAQQQLNHLNNQDKALVGYGLGKAYEQKKQYDNAFQTFQCANKARQQVSGKFDPDAFDKRIEHMLTLFSAEFFSARKGWGNTSSQPVFIVGLPRSGTTLTEQILASHAQCFGAGELSDLSDLATGTPNRLNDNSVSWPDCANTLNAQHTSAIGNEYLTRAAARAPRESLRIVDKQPLNFWHIGLIAMALPNAKIIHCIRDIRDCGYSIFSQNFSLQQTWSTDLAHIAHYWRGYKKLMQHWQQVTKLEILQVDYAQTVNEQELQSRRLLDFIKLPWSDSVLQFHTAPRAVQTPSKWQVRQPIYRTSSARWRHYQAHLEPLIHAYDQAQR